MGLANKVMPETTMSMGCSTIPKKARITQSEGAPLVVGLGGAAD